MQSIKDAAGEFLANRRIAVTGVSRKPENHVLTGQFHRALRGQPPRGRRASKRVGNVQNHIQWFTLLDQLWVR